MQRNIRVGKIMQRNIRVVKIMQRNIRVGKIMQRNIRVGETAWGISWDLVVDDFTLCPSLKPLFLYIYCKESKRYDMTCLVKNSALQQSTFFRGSNGFAEKYFTIAGCEWPVTLYEEMVNNQNMPAVVPNFYTSKVEIIPLRISIIIYRRGPV